MSEEQKEQASKQEQTPLQTLRQQFAEELQRDNVTAQQLSEQLQQLANKREQLKGAIFAMDAAMQTLARTEAEAKAEAKAETKADAKEETKSSEAEEATAVTAEQ